MTQPIGAQVIIQDLTIGTCIRTKYKDASKKIPTYTAGKIIKIKPRAKTVVVEYWTCRGNKRNEHSLPFFTEVELLDVSSVVYGPEKYGNAIL